MRALGTIDRRYIYIVIALCIIIPLLTGKILPIRVSPPVRSAFNAIESLKEDSYVLISIDYDPAAKPELQPMLIALLHHTFKRNLKVILMAHWPLGLPLGQDALVRIAHQYNKRYGEDYVNIGYRPGAFAVMLGIGREIRDLFDVDNAGTPLDSLPMMKTVHNYNDIELLIGIEAGATGDQWIQVANAQFGQKILIGCTAVVAPDKYPYLQSGQIEGLIGGLKGAAEYEAMVKKMGDGTIGMTAQSAGHVAIVIFIIIGNLSFFLTRRRQ